jgi:hypothetical protein
MDPKLRVALLSTYADQLTQALAPPGLDARALAEWIAGFTFQDLADREIHAALPDWVIQVTAELDDELLAASAVGALIRAGLLDRLHEDDILKIKGIAGLQASEGWFPFIDVITPRSGARRLLDHCRSHRAGASSRVDVLGPSAGHPRQLDLAKRLIDQGIDPNQPYMLPAMLSLVEIKQVEPGSPFRHSRGARQGEWRNGC